MVTEAFDCSISIFFAPIMLPLKVSQNSFWLTFAQNYEKITRIFLGMRSCARFFFLSFNIWYNFTFWFEPFAATTITIYGTWSFVYTVQQKKKLNISYYLLHWNGKCTWVIRKRWAEVVVRARRAMRIQLCLEDEFRSNIY